MKNLIEAKFIKRFHATGLFLYPLKISKFSDVFRVYRKTPVAEMA